MAFASKTLLTLSFTCAYEGAIYDIQLISPHTLHLAIDLLYKSNLVSGTVQMCVLKDLCSHCN